MEIHDLLDSNIPDSYLKDTYRRILIRRQQIDNISEIVDTRMHFTLRRMYFNLDISLILERIENQSSYCKRSYIELWYTMARNVRRELLLKNKDGSFHYQIFHKGRLSLP